MNVLGNSLGGSGESFDREPAAKEAERQNGVRASMALEFAIKLSQPADKFRFTFDRKFNIKELKTRKENLPSRYLERVSRIANLTDLPEDLRNNSILKQKIKKLFDPYLEKKQRTAMFVAVQHDLGNQINVDEKALLNLGAEMLEDNLYEDTALKILGHGDDESDARKMVLANEFNQKIANLEESLANGEITPEEYEIAKAQYYKEGVRDYGDQEMQELWEKYEKGELEIAKKDLEDYFVEIVCHDGSLNMPEIQLAYSEAAIALTGTGVQINQSFMDGVHVETTDGFSVPVNIKRSDSGKFLFYLKDQTAHDGLAGPFSAQEIADGVDDRHIDSFLTSKVQNILHDNSLVAEIPDEDLIHLVRQIIGRGSDRNFAFEKKHENWLKNLAVILVQPDESTKSVSFYKKIEILNQFAAEPNQVLYLQQQLTKGAKTSVKALIEEYRSKNT